MAKTLTIEEQRDCSNAGFEREEYNPTVDFSVPTNRRRNKIFELLDARAELENLASTQAQREKYGAEEWHRHFRLLRDVHTHPNLPQTGEALRTYLWNAIPYSRFKRFQELFSRPEHFMIPKFRVGGEGRIFFPLLLNRNIDFNRMELLPCQVDGDRIPDALAESLGFCDFTDDRGDPLARLKKKRDAIPRLKKLWEAAEPIEERNQRILIIRGTENSVPQQRYPNVPGPSPAVIGTILYTKTARKNHGSFPPRLLAVQHFASAYGAYRKTLHEANGYAHRSTLDHARQENFNARDRQALETTLAEHEHHFRECGRIIQEAIDTTVTTAHLDTIIAHMNAIKLQPFLHFAKTLKAQCTAPSTDHLRAIQTTIAEQARESALEREKQSALVLHRSHDGGPP